MCDLKGKVIVITGADGGMGLETVKRLGNSGAKFALCSNNEKGLKRLGEFINDSNNFFFQAVDVTDEKQVESFFVAIKSKFGAADMLLNFAGLSLVGKVWETEQSVYDKIIDVNLKGSFLCCKYFVPLVNVDKGGKIINIGSMAARRANGNAPLYCTAKAAVNMFSECLSIQSKDSNIQVTTLNPGSTDTGFWGDRPVAKDKFMQAADIAEVIEFVLKFNNKVVFKDIWFESFL